MASTLHTYVPLPCYSSQHIDSSALNIPLKRQQTAAQISHAIATYVPSTNIISDATYMPQIQISQHA